MKKKTEHSGRDRDRDIIYQRWSELSFAEKGKYITSYYGLAIGIVIFAVIVATFLVKDICKKEMEDAFYVMIADVELAEDITETMQQELSEILGLDSRTQRCRIEAGYSGRRNVQSEAVISAYMRSGQVDVVIAPEEVFNRYAVTGYLSPLKECGLEEWEEESEAEALFYAKPIDYSEAGAVTDIPCHPHEITKESKCYGIYLQGGLFDGCVAGVMVNCPNQEHVRVGIEYFQEKSGGR